VTAEQRFQVAVVGGGPAGLAAAIAAAEHGLATIVLERGAFPPDKACGEGLLPPGVRALEHLGVLRHVDPSSCRRFRGIRFLQEDESSAEAPLPAGGGLGVRRTALVLALARRASEVGVVLRSHFAVRGVERNAAAALVTADSGTIRADAVVAADGLHSPIRRAAGLDGRRANRRRFALRRHWQIRPWTDHVEVYVDSLGEAVVTPVGDSSINVNFVWQDGEFEDPTIERLASRFPRLAERLATAAHLSEVRGAGPMSQSVVRRSADRLVLVGDAAGFVDSISADGLSIAFNSAILLGRELPGAIARGATAASFTRYERAARGLFRSYWAVTNGLLWIARHPRFRRALIHRLERHPAVCEAMMGGAMKLMLSAVPT
jgi:flavin-dependent dehydrogenase